MIVSDILSEKGGTPLSTPSNALLGEAIDQMVAHGVGSLVVIDDGALVGIITERDILRAAAQPDEVSIRQHKVAKIMSSQVVTCRPGDPLEAVMALMQTSATQKGIRHLPIVEDEQLIGMVSMRDVIGALLKETRYENKLLKQYIKDWPEDQQPPH